MPTETLTPLSGYYGKVPTQGDFVKNRLPYSFIQPWDDWLQSAIHFSHKQLQQKEWLDAYLTAPIYRFVLTPGICGETGWIGILMSSVDRVGRYFPLTLAAPLPPALNPFQALTIHDPWFNKAQELALSVLDETFEKPHLDQALPQLDRTLATHQPHPTPEPGNPDAVTEGITIRHPLKSVSSLPGSYPTLMDTLLRETCFAYSLWWTKGSEAINSSLLITQGLPPVENTVALYDGNWKRWGWQQKKCTPWE